MKLCRMLGGLKYDIITKHRICILRGDSGTGKSLMFRTLDAYFSLEGAKSIYVDYNNYQVMPWLQGMVDCDYMFLDNADLYIARMDFDMLLKSNVECFIASREMGLVDCEQMGFYHVKYENGTISMREG